MTFQELQNKIGTQEEANWHQHENGGGWVNKSAKVDKTAHIGDNAIVWAQVSGNARVYGNAWEKSPLFIVGSKYSLSNAKHGHIQIGCKLGTFDWLLSEEGTEFGKYNGFTDNEVAEYRLYVELFKEIGK